MTSRTHTLHRIILIVFCAMLASCAGGKKVKKPRYDCSKRLAMAVENFNKKKYSSVKTTLDDMKIQCAGASGLDTAGYYLGMALLQMKLFGDAKLEFTRLMQDFPNSPFYEEALFRIAYSVLKGSRPVDRDQTETLEANRLLRDFLENYPSGAFADSAQYYLKQTVNKLARKEFDAARFYQKIGENEAAFVYYSSFIRDFPGSELAGQASLNLAQILIDLKRTAEAREVLDRLIEQETNSDVVKKARELLARCRQ